MEHVIRMDKDRRANQVMTWFPEGKGEEEDHGRSGQRCLRMLWDESRELVMDRHEWRSGIT